MEKPFLEVFPGLHIGDELKELLKLVMVEKVAMPKDRSSLRIYIVSPRLIHKQNIYSMEEGIAKQLFPGRPLTVKIHEKCKFYGWCFLRIRNETTFCIMRISEQLRC